MIVVDNQDRTLSVENHIDTLDPYCTPEQLTRWHYYPPPYYDTIQHIWKYRHPWLWYDGNKHGGRDYANWRPRIENQLTVPASVTIRISGSYDPATRAGTVKVVYRNDSTGIITQARAIVAITEDSIRWIAPSGDSVHNNVARDYVPDPDGQVFSIPAGDSAIIAQYFTLDSAWNFDRCLIVTWLQSDLWTADSNKPVYQGSKKPVSELDQFAAAEQELTGLGRSTTTAPNPCSVHRGTRFNFILDRGEPYRIAVFDIQGRKIREIPGIAKSRDNRIFWDCRDDNGARVGSGVYLYRITGRRGLPASGKLIVK